MERYWTLKYLQQHGVQELDAAVIKAFPGEPPVVRAVSLPLVTGLQSAPALERGTLVRIKIGHIDTMALDVTATFVSVLETATVSTSEDDSTEEETTVGALTIAMDVEDAATDAEPPVAPA